MTVALRRCASLRCAPLAAPSTRILAIAGFTPSQLHVQPVDHRLRSSFLKTELPEPPLSSKLLNCSTAGK